MEEMGMTDLQYKAHLREVIEALEEVIEKGVSEEAEAKIRKMIERYQASIED